VAGVVWFDETQVALGVDVKNGDRQSLVSIARNQRLMYPGCLNTLACIFTTPSKLRKPPGGTTEKSSFHMQEFDANILKFFKALGFDVLILNYS
jgi:hypothetical protein